METYNDWLEHFGIPGMHWGDRNGPPYPLNKSKVQKLKERRKKLKEKEKEQNLRFENAKLKRKIKEDERASKREAKLQKIEEKERDRQLKSRRDEVKRAGYSTKRIRKIENKSIKKMSDEELNFALSRREKEKKLMDLNRQSMGHGKAFIRQLLLMGGTTAATVFVSKLATAKAEHLAAKWMFNHKDGYTKDFKDAEEVIKKISEKTKESTKKAIDKTEKSGSKAAKESLDNLRKAISGDQSNSSPKKTSEPESKTKTNPSNGSGYYQLSLRDVFGSKTTDSSKSSSVRDAVSEEIRKINRDRESREVFAKVKQDAVSKSYDNVYDQQSLQRLMSEIYKEKTV